MTPRRRKTAGCVYPDFDERDILRDGHLSFCRNPAGRRFGKNDAIRIEAAWETLDDVPATVANLQDQEKVRAAREPAAWDPEFGYLSPDPQFCGANVTIACMVHLEGLSLLGDVKPVLAGLDAVRLNAWGFEADTLRDAAHIYRIENRFSLGLSAERLVARVTDVLRALVRQEINARRHLVEEDKRVLADAIARAFAILRAARLLSPWELTDILSPIRMAAAMGFIDGITKEEIDSFTLDQFEQPPDSFTSDEAVRNYNVRDATFADHINKRFTRVTLNARGRKLLES